jgi:phosphatidylserine decarboxylase
MENHRFLLLTALGLGAALFGAFLFWRYVWFDRNPKRTPPEGENILSPADGTVVYVRRIAPGEPVVSLKRGRSLHLVDLLREDAEEEKLVIGVFMSPFNVHVNRAPLSGIVESVRHHPAIRRNHHMGAMHWRTVLKRFPLFENSPHLFENERTVVRMRGTFAGEPVSCYVNLIAGGSVRGIETLIQGGSRLSKGDALGRIRIGSQVDTVVSWRPGMVVRVQPGQTVRAGESIMVEAVESAQAVAAPAGETSDPGNNQRG